MGTKDKVPTTSHVPNPWGPIRNTRAQYSAFAFGGGKALSEHPTLPNQLNDPRADGSLHKSQQPKIVDDMITSPPTASRRPILVYTDAGANVCLGSEWSKGA